MDRLAILSNSVIDTAARCFDRDVAARTQNAVAVDLAHEAERERIARAGQQLAFSRHTYAHRLDELLDVVARNPGARAPARTAGRCIASDCRSKHMRLSGTPVSGAHSLPAEGNTSGSIIANRSVGVARGIGRPVVQRLRGLWRAKP